MYNDKDNITKDEKVNVKVESKVIKDEKPIQKTEPRKPITTIAKAEEKLILKNKLKTLQAKAKELKLKGQLLELPKLKVTIDTMDEILSACEAYKFLAIVTILGQLDSSVEKMVKVMYNSSGMPTEFWVRGERKF